MTFSRSYSLMSSSKNVWDSGLLFKRSISSALHDMMSALIEECSLSQTSLSGFSLFIKEVAVVGYLVEIYGIPVWQALIKSWWVLCSQHYGPNTEASSPTRYRE